MSKSNQLAANQWWLDDGGRVMFIAFDERTVGAKSDIPILAYAADRYSDWYKPSNFVRRLPDDAGFDYKPEPEYPQWRVPPEATMLVPVEGTTPWLNGDRKHVAFYKYDDPRSGTVFHTDGTHVKFRRDSESTTDRVVTQAEAEARIVRRKSAEPDPEEWVTQDRVPDRTGIDQWRRTDTKFGNTDWEYSADGISKYIHGHVSNVGSVFEVRCLRKHLPPFPEQPQKPNRIPVRLWGRIDKGGAHMYVFASESPPVGADTKYAEIKFDPQLNITASGFYVEGPEASQ